MILKKLSQQRLTAPANLVNNPGDGAPFLAQFLQYHLGNRCFYTTGGKGSDIVHQIVQRQHPIEVVIFDYPRKTKPEFYNWNLFEDFKNGIVNSGKYNSVCLHFPSIKVLVLGNHELEDVRDNLSYDRWDVHNLADYPFFGSEMFDYDPEKELAGTGLYQPAPVPSSSSGLGVPDDLLFPDDFDFGTGFCTHCGDRKKYYDNTGTSVKHSCTSLLPYGTYCEECGEINVSNHNCKENNSDTD